MKNDNLEKRKKMNKNDLREHGFNFISPHDETSEENYLLTPALLVSLLANVDKCMITWSISVQEMANELGISESIAKEKIEHLAYSNLTEFLGISNTDELETIYHFAVYLGKSKYETNVMELPY